MNLEMMRLSLWPRADVAAADAKDAHGRTIRRETWLREVFSAPIVFTYRGSQFHYVPTVDGIDPRFIAGRIGLMSRVRENEPPEAGLEDTTRERWKAIAVLIDPRGHKDGQKVAVEFGTGVAKPFPIFSALIYHINRSKPLTPYRMDVKQISNAMTFWEFVAKNEGEVTSVTFEFLAPNMFGIEDDMDREADELKKREKARRAALTIENEQGLNLHTERVKRTVNYTARGGGEIAAKAKRDNFRSGRSALRVRVPDDPEGSLQPSASLRSRIARAIRYVFLND